MGTRSALDYLGLLKSLLPKGKVWTRAIGSILHQVLYAEAEELSRTEGRIEQLITVERDTRTTDEILENQETEYALPDDCSEIPGTVQSRRKQLHTKFLSLGGQHKQYYIDLVVALGFTIKIIEYVFNRFHWTVVHKSGDVLCFICGSSECGDLLCSVPLANILQCALNKLKPAHTEINFQATDYAFGAGFGPGFDTVWKQLLTSMQGGFGRGFGIAFDVRYGGGFGRGFGRGFNRVIIPPNQQYGLGFGSGFGPGFQKPKVVGW